MKYKQYSREFKLETLKLLETSGKSVTEIENDLGLTPGLLYKWRRRYQVAKDEPGEVVLQASDQETLERENRRLKRELEIAKQERGIR